MHDCKCSFSSVFANKKYADQLKTQIQNQIDQVKKSGYLANPGTEWSIFV
jgi:hypothetical protein